MQPSLPTRLSLRQAYLFVVSASLVGLLVSGWMFPLIGIAFPAQNSANCPSAPEVSGVPARDFLNLSIFVNPKAGTEFFVPANFTIPADTIVEVTLDDFDTGASSVDSQYAQVCGTVNGTIAVDGHAVSEVAVGTIAHTMTFTNGPYAGFNIPVPAANASAAVPARITFSVYFSVPGQYRWECKASCGQTQMSLDGRMSGLVTVQGR